jgi:phage-related protein
MTEGKTGRRPLFWEGSAKRDFKQFPEAVQKDTGVALFVVQLGGTPLSAKPCD